MTRPCVPRWMPTTRNCCSRTCSCPFCTRRTSRRCSPWGCTASRFRASAALGSATNCCPRPLKPPHRFGPTTTTSRSCARRSNSRPTASMPAPATVGRCRKTACAATSCRLRSNSPVPTGLTVSATTARAPASALPPWARPGATPCRRWPISASTRRFCRQSASASSRWPCRFPWIGTCIGTSPMAWRRS